MIADANLVRPHARFRDSYVAALREGFVWGTRAAPDAAAIAFIAGHFSDYLRTLDADGQIITSAHGRPQPGTPSLTFWLVAEAGFIGAVSIRPRVDTHALAHYGGHVGYAIRPSQRGRGYGRRQLALALDLCRGMGIGIARLSCAEDNAASRRVIEANGGLLLRRGAPAWYAPAPFLLYEIPLV